MYTGKAVLGNGFYYFHSSKIKFDYSKVAGEAAKNYLTKVSTIFQSKLDKTCGDECIFIPRTEINITFNVMLPQMTLNWNTDESYTLDISKSGRIFTHSKLHIRMNLLYKKLYYF